MIVYKFQIIIIGAVLKTTTIYYIYILYSYNKGQGRAHSGDTGLLEISVLKEHIYATRRELHFVSLDLFNLHLYLSNKFFLKISRFLTMPLMINPKQPKSISVNLNLCIPSFIHNSSM